MSAGDYASNAPTVRPIHGPERREIVLPVTIGAAIFG